MKGPAGGETLDRLLVEAAIRCPEANAVVGEFGSLSHAELLIRAQNIAALLRRKKLAPGSPVGIVMEQSPSTIAAIAGIILAGASYAPLPRHPRQPAAVRLLRANGVATVLFDGSLEGSTEASKQWATLGNVLDLARMEQVTMPSSEETRMPWLSADAPAALMIGNPAEVDTTATTLSHRAIALLARSKEVVSAGAADTFMLRCASARPAGVFELWASLLRGATLAMEPEHTLTAEAFGRWVKSHSICVLCLPVDRVHDYADRAPDVFARLRHLIVEVDGRSGPLSARRASFLMREYPKLRITQVFVLPRSGLYATAYRLPSDIAADDAVPIGRTLQGFRLAIVDEHSQAVAEGDFGQLAIAEDRPGDLSASLKATGARAKVRSDGLAELQVAAEPRLVEAVKPPPFQAADVEAILAGQTRVREAAVIQQADDAGKAQLVAFVEMDTPPKDSLRTEAKVQFEASIKHSLPSAAMVSAIRYVDAMPRDASGHVDRQALQERWRLERRLPPHAMQAYRFSLDTLEEISSLWKRLLQNDAIGYDEDFFDAGGTPVRLIRMHAELNRRFPGAISMGQLSVLTSIRKIHEHLLKYYAEQGRASLHRRGA